jgi:precorrin-6Y C5,15-methyltransferase (decarboxylating)
LPKTTIVGLSDDGLAGLSNQARAAIETASVVIGSQQLLDLIDDSSSKGVAIGGDLTELTATLEQHQGKEIVLLSSGDPLFYGTARFLCDTFGKESFDVVPHVSSMQLAFARIKESWDEAYLTNLATQTIDKAAEKIRSAEKVGIFTSEAISPTELARYLLNRGLHYFTVYVCENLGSPDERVTKGSLQDIADQTFSNLNVVILIRKTGVPDQASDMTTCRMFGNPDEFFLQSQPKRGLLTPSEVRAIAISEMELRSDSIIWDVGAGSGSVTIESAQVAHRGMAYGIEMDIDDYNLLVENAQRFGVGNVVPIHGEAPDAWRGLPDPDAIFVGGTGRAIGQIVELAFKRLRTGGCLVASVADLENFGELKRIAEESLLLEPQIWLLQISRTNDQLGRSRLAALNPSFLVKITKPAKDGD